jgi:hypothetical protein
MNPRNDFDFLFGKWTVRHRRLRQRGEGTELWDEFTGTAETRPLLGGLCNIEEHVIPDALISGAALRTCDTSSGLWSIYWVSARRGILEPPVTGAFEGDLGHFEGSDFDDSRPVRVRFVWDRTNPDAPLWEQFFSYDGGTTWEANWVMRFERARSA